ncbi:ABC transporter substrate-binding protein [Nakamurella endophytica]|uniref:ABC transporter substrate-binding protein n=2 Tax=Nakamurella endophytica TaxID=1748367 RepID=A0A917WES8_9ACTN|nr:ABC transporter substrate-binding protein [Nakamurella endophytica]
MAQKYQTAHPGVTIKVVNVPGSDMMTKLQAAVSSRTLPDISIGDLVNVPRLVQTGRLVDLTPLIPQADWSDMYPAMLSFGTKDDQQLSIPVSANDLGLMYNADLVRQAGFDPAKPPTTWDEMKTAAAAIKAKTGKAGFELFTQAGDNGEGLTWNFQVSLWQAGGEFLDEGNTKAAFNSDAGRKALQYWVDLIDAKASPLAPWGEFEKGNAASAQEGSWMVGIWADKPPFTFGTAQIPAPADGRKATNLGGEQAVVYSSDDAREKAAADFLAWFDGPAQNLSWSEQTGFLPVRRSVAEGAEYKSFVAKTSPRMQPFVDALPTAHARPNTPQYAEASLAFAKQVEKALYGKATVEQALSAAEADVNQVLSATP